MNDITLSIVVVTWNCRILALNCLRNVASSVIGAAYEVIVIDNASADGTADAIAAEFPDVSLIRNPSNTGFAAANNVALAQASGRYWLLLNPDAFPACPDAIAQLLRFLEATLDVGAVAPCLLHADGRHQVGDAGFAPTLRSLAVHALGLTRFFAGARSLFISQAAGAAPLDVDWLCGACMMVRADTGREVGLLDTRFFMYGEDMEWGCRMRDHGWRVVYLPALEAVHLQGGTQVVLPDAKTMQPSTKWLDGLAQLYRQRNGRWTLAVRAILGLGYSGRALAYGMASLLPGRRHLRARALAMTRYAGHSVWLR